MEVGAQRDSRSQEQLPTATAGYNAAAADHRVTTATQLVIF